MGCNRPPGDEQALRDLAVCKALRSEPHDPELRFSEALPSEPRPPMPARAHARGRGSISHPFARPFPLGGAAQETSSLSEGYAPSGAESSSGRTSELLPRDQLRLPGAPPLDGELGGLGRLTANPRNAQRHLRVCRPLRRKRGCFSKAAAPSARERVAQLQR
jgi:hypothetical protein